MSSPQELYQQEKAQREAERAKGSAKAKGLFTKEELHNLIGSALHHFLQDLQTADPFVVGIGANTYPLGDLVYNFQAKHKLHPDWIDETWSDQIKK